MSGWSPANGCPWVQHCHVHAQLANNEELPWTCFSKMCCLLGLSLFASLRGPEIGCPCPQHCHVHAQLERGEKCGTAPAMLLKDKLPDRSCHSHVHKGAAAPGVAPNGGSFLVAVPAAAPDAAPNGGSCCGSCCGSWRRLLVAAPAAAPGGAPSGGCCCCCFRICHARDPYPMVFRLCLYICC